MQALGGARVLDLSIDVAGAYCGKLLADYGAEVIKVESPGRGDPLRSVDPADDSSYSEKSPLFLHLNANKQGITLDIECATGQEVFKELVQVSDVVIESFSPGRLPELGLGYETLASKRESLVMTSISPFGPDGPYRDYKSTDIVDSAMGAWTYAHGDRDREPLQPGGPYTGYVTGIIASIGTLMAVFGARNTGLGQQVWISGMESALTTIIYDWVRLSYTGEPRLRHGHRFGQGSTGTAGTSIQPSGDGYFLLLGGPHREGLGALLDAPELSDDPQFKSGESWVANSDGIEALLRPMFEKFTTDELFHRGQLLRLPLAPVAKPEDLVNSPHLHERGYFIPVEHPVAGRLLHTGPVYRMSGTPYSMNRAAPTLGQDNDAVYEGLLGLDREFVGALRSLGVI